MGSKVVVTYKRKRLFSRSDHSPINLHSDKPSEISASKASANLDNHDESIAEHTLQNKDTEFGTCRECSKDKVGENMLQCEYCAQEKFNAEEKSAATRSNPFFVKSGSEYEDKCEDALPNEDINEEDTISNKGKCEETLSISPTPGASCGIESDMICSKMSDGIDCSHQTKEASISRTFASEEKNELSKDQCSSFCDNLGTKRQLTSTLITFCRRSKRNRDNAANGIASECTDKCASASVTPLAASCSVDVKNEKKSPEDANNSCSFSAPAAAMPMHVDDPLHSPHGTAENAEMTVARVFHNSHEEISSLGEKVCMGVRDNRRVYLSAQDLSNEDVKSRSIGSLSSLDLSISPPASRDIDCNIPLEYCDSDENHQAGPLEVVHDSLGSTSESNKNLPSLLVQYARNGSLVRAVSDKGKFVVDTPPVKNNCIQLFPENRSNDVFQLPNDSEKANQLLSSSLHSSCIHNLPMQSEKMVNNGHAAYYSSLYEWPHIQSREPFPDFLPSTSNRANSLSRHLMMLDSILTRARATRGNKIGFWDKFEFPTTWSEEELDSLWIGVRRHGVNNWDTILRDRRLHFSPWKTTRDLADRWREEQYRLFHGTPVSQVKYASRPDFLSSHMAGVQLSLGVQQNPLHDRGAQKRPPVQFTRNWQFQKPVTNGFVKGNLPHWLREAVEIPLRPAAPARNVVPSVCNSNFDCSGNSQQPWPNTKNAPVRRTEPPRTNSPLVMKRGKSELQDDLIVITSDASSEETISDDHSIRP